MCLGPGMDTVLGKAAPLDKYQKTGNPADFPDYKASTTAGGNLLAAQQREGPVAAPINPTAPAIPVGGSTAVRAADAGDVADVFPKPTSLLGM